MCELEWCFSGTVIPAEAGIHYLTRPAGGPFLPHGAKATVPSWSSVTGHWSLERPTTRCTVPLLRGRLSEAKRSAAGGGGWRKQYPQRIGTTVAADLVGHPPPRTPFGAPPRGRPWHALSCDPFAARRLSNLATPTELACPYQTTKPTTDLGLRTTDPNLVFGIRYLLLTVSPPTVRPR